MSIASIVNLAAGKIGELLVQEAKLLYGVEDQVHILQEELRMMNSYLQDMEAIDENGGDERSRTTIKQIRKIAYDDEDVTESYILEASSSTDKKEGIFKRYLCFCSSLLRTHRAASETEAIIESINKIIERCKKYMGENGIRVDPRQGLSKSRARMRPVAYPYTTEDHVLGLKEDIDKLVGVLTTNEDTKIEVVSIVGMVGSGKTTLARQLFNDKTVEKHFDYVTWVSISQQWVVQQILLDLLKKFEGETIRIDETSSLEVLQQKLHRYLERKRYLIVLDDVWEEQALIDILPALPSGRDKRKIIVTTCNEEVVSYPDLKPLTHRHEPRRLNGKDSWELFEKIALPQRKEDSDSIERAKLEALRKEDSDSIERAKLEALGKEMLEKCRGLPLAVVAVAGILSQKKTLEEWERVKKAVASRIMEEGKGTHSYGPVNKMLTLSYCDLPRELKPCLLYLARYPEDYEIPVGELIKMWIAEGFFTSIELHEGDTLEDVARQYLDKLVHRYLVEVASRNYEGKVKTIRIHILVREICLKKAKEGDFLETFISKGRNSDTIVTEARRTVIFSHDRILLPFPTQSPHLHSLIYEVDLIAMTEVRSSEVIHQNFRLLRVLILDGIITSSDTLPEGIGSLIHLRYLCLSRTNISKLPSSIGNLRNLLTLSCRNDKRCFFRKLLMIPDVVWKIKGLRHLYLYSEGLENLKLDTLTCLQTLKGVRGGNWMLKELPCLSPSVQKLNIDGISSQEQLDAAFKCPSISSDRLHSLFLNWIRYEVVKLKDLDPIIQCQHLRKLSLRGRIEDRLSGIQFPASIHMLVLSGTKFEAEATLVALSKLPHLTHLALLEHAYMGTQWNCNAGEFPRLKKLSMRNLPNLEEWIIERGAMPQLKTLEIWSCKKLRKLPEELKFITTMQEL